MLEEAAVAQLVLVDVSLAFGILGSVDFAVAEPQMASGKGGFPEFSKVEPAYREMNALLPAVKIGHFDLESSRCRMQG